MLSKQRVFLCHVPLMVPKANHATSIPVEICCGCICVRAQSTQTVFSLLLLSVNWVIFLVLTIRKFPRIPLAPSPVLHLLTSPTRAVKTTACRHAHQVCRWAFCLFICHLSCCAGFHPFTAKNTYYTLILLPSGISKNPPNVIFKTNTTEPFVLLSRIQWLVMVVGLAWILNLWMNLHRFCDSGWYLWLSRSDFMFCLLHSQVETERKCEERAEEWHAAKVEASCDSTQKTALVLSRWRAPQPQPLGHITQILIYL